MVFRPDFGDGVQHILRAGIHGLSALDQIVRASSLKISVRPWPADTAIKPASFSGSSASRSHVLLRLLFRKLLSVFDQFLLVLFAHIIDLHPGKSAVCESPFNGLAGWLV